MSDSSACVGSSGVPAARSAATMPHSAPTTPRSSVAAECVASTSVVFIPVAAAAPGVVAPISPATDPSPSPSPDPAVAVATCPSGGGGGCWVLWSEVAGRDDWREPAHDDEGVPS